MRAELRRVAAMSCACVHVHVVRPDGEAASVLHRVARVDGKIDEHLIELARVNSDVPKFRPERKHYLDVLADESAQHLVRLDDVVVEVEDFGLEYLLAREGEELARQISGALAGLPYL